MQKAIDFEIDRQVETMSGKSRGSFCKSFFALHKNHKLYGAMEVSDLSFTMVWLLIAEATAATV